MVRHAFTMIELIFALVIMSIVFISLPIVLINNQRSLEGNLMQESVFLASSKMSQILTYQWDENSSDTGVGILSASDVVDVTAGDNALDRNETIYRVGHFKEDKHRRMSPELNVTRSATAIGVEATGILDDIDDFDGQADESIIASTSEIGYKKKYRADINVTYIRDDTFHPTTGTDYTSNSIDFIFTETAPAGAGLQTSNLKLIYVSIDQEDKLNDWTQTVLLRSYVANIGETGYFKRRY